MTTNPLSRIRSKSSLYVSILFFIFSFGFLFYRLHFGVDFQDEPSYVGLALRLFFGQKLFSDELFLIQTFSILTLPFLKLHLALAHSLSGVILFMRLMTWGLYLFLGGIIFLILKTRVDTPTALIVAASTCLYFPGNMVTLSYNTLGTLFLTLSLFLIHFGLLRRHKGILLLAGMTMAIGSIAYITFLSMTVFLILYLWVFGSQKRFCLFFILGAMLIYFYPMGFILSNFRDFVRAWDFRNEIAHSTPTFFQIIQVVHKFFPKTVLASILAFSIVTYVSHRRYSKIFLGCLLLTPLLARQLCVLSYGGWSLFPFYLSLLSLFSFYKLRQNALAIHLLKWIFIPSSVAGFVTSLTSASGYISSQVGMLAACLVGLLFLAEAMKEISGRITYSALFSLGLPVFFLLSFPLNIWSDSAFRNLTEKVSLGPFQGLYTSPEKKQISEIIYQELHPLLQTKGPLLIYPNFPGGYLMGMMAPAKGIIWYQNSGKTNEILAGMYQNQMNPESRVLRMKRYYFNPEMKPFHIFDPKDPLNNLIETTHQSIKDTEWFTLFAPKQKVSAPKS